MARKANAVIKTVNAQACSHVCIWRESARALTHVLKHTVSIDYHKEKRYTFAYSLSASTIYHQILQFRNNLPRLWDDLARLWVCAGQTESLLFVHAKWRHLFLAGMCMCAKPPNGKDIRTTDEKPGCKNKNIGNEQELIYKEYKSTERKKS